MKRLDREFFNRRADIVASELIGKILVSNLGDESISLRITETEAYIGEEDTACHARFGKTQRSKTLYMQAGTIYVYLCYGIHEMLNIVTEKVDNPQAVLIRGVEGYQGPGKLTQYMGINRSINEKDIVKSKDIYILDDDKKFKIKKDKRVGISYASPKDQNRKWRFLMDNIII